MPYLYSEQRQERRGARREDSSGHGGPIVIVTDHSARDRAGREHRHVGIAMVSCGTYQKGGYARMTLVDEIGGTSVCDLDIPASTRAASGRATTRKVKASDLVGHGSRKRKKYTMGRYGEGRRGAAMASNDSPPSARIPWSKLP